MHTDGFLSANLVIWLLQKKKKTPGYLVCVQLGPSAGISIFKLWHGPYTYFSIVSKYSRCMRLLSNQWNLLREIGGLAIILWGKILCGCYVVAVSCSIWLEMNNQTFHNKIIATAENVATKSGAKVTLVSDLWGHWTDSGIQVRFVVKGIFWLQDALIGLWFFCT